MNYLFILKKSNCSHSFFQIYCVFAEQELQYRDTKTNYDTSFVSGMHVLKEVCYMTTSFPAIHFFYDSVIISREHLKQSTCQGNCLYFTILFATIHYNKRSAVDSRKSWRLCLFEENHGSLAEGSYLFHSPSCNNFCLKSTVLNAQKHLQRSHSFMVNQYSEITFIFL